MTMSALTAEATESAAKALAEACNGGDWARDYTEAQKDLWRERVRAGMTDRMYKKQVANPLEVIEVSMIDHQHKTLFAQVIK